jgi:hypothetical protein
MENLLEETQQKLENNGKTPNDVKWVGYKNGTKATSWEGFVKLAKDHNYDNGYGGENIHLSLVVVGDDWWLGRQEYDGSEWWEFFTLPVLKEKFSELTQENLLAEFIRNGICRNH